MFKRLGAVAECSIEFRFNGQCFSAAEGDTVAAALIAAGVTSLRRSPVSGQPRAPYCMMGACFECLVQIDGRSVQACMTPVQAGMQVLPYGTEKADDAN